MLKGPLHVHSQHSDGDFTLGELREVFLSAGCAFACMTDHAEWLEGRKLENYRRGCESLSDERFCFIPGLEYECDRKMHILGYGVTSRVRTRIPEEVIRHIDDEGGISVIAHPKNEFFSWIESFEALPSGIECWNSKYDGQYAPRPATFLLLHKLQLRKPDMRAFYGQDLHYQKQFSGLLTEVQCERATPADLLAALSVGNYMGNKNELALPSSGSLPPELLERFGRVQSRYAPLRRGLKVAKRTADRLGIPVPSTILTNFRRIF